MLQLKGKQVNSQHQIDQLRRSLNRTRWVFGIPLFAASVLLLAVSPATLIMEADTIVAQRIHLIDSKGEVRAEVSAKGLLIRDKDGLTGLEVVREGMFISDSKGELNTALMLGQLRFCEGSMLVRTRVGSEGLSVRNEKGKPQILATYFKETGPSVEIIGEDGETIARLSKAN